MMSTVIGDTQRCCWCANGVTTDYRPLIVTRLHLLCDALEVAYDTILPSFPHLLPNTPLPSCVSHLIPSIASTIDHTLLGGDATSDDILHLCQSAIQNSFYAVCVNGCHARTAVLATKQSEVRVACVVGFPLGCGTVDAKVAEAVELVNLGVHEIDMVLNRSLVREKRYKDVVNEVRSVVESVSVAHRRRWQEGERRDGEHENDGAGAAFIKTSTGVGYRGATVTDVAVMRQCAGDKRKVKASGGIRSAETTQSMICHGAQRLGTSSGTKIIATDDRPSVHSNSTY